MLSVLHEKLAEAHGLAIAAATVSTKLEERVGDHTRVVFELGRMRLEARETRERCLTVERTLGEELATEMLAHSNSTAETASDLAGAWFKAGTDPVRAWFFLVMGETAEAAAWRTVKTLAYKGAALEVDRLADWALPIQERHLETAFQCLRLLVDRIDPLAPRWG